MDAFSASLERSKAFVHDWAKKEVGASERPGASEGRSTADDGHRLQVKKGRMPDSEAVSEAVALCFTVVSEAERFRKRISFVDLSDTSKMSEAVPRMDFLIEASGVSCAAVHLPLLVPPVSIFLGKSGIGLRVFEAVSEDFETKQSCFSVLQALLLSREEATASCFETREAAGLPERSVLASNTSSISITKLAAKVPRPMRNSNWHYTQPDCVQHRPERVIGCLAGQECGACAESFQAECLAGLAAMTPS